MESEKLPKPGTMQERFPYRPINFDTLNGGTIQLDICRTCGAIVSIDIAYGPETETLSPLYRHHDWHEERGE